MNISQQMPNRASTSGPDAGHDAARWVIDDDIALGCECANPALQIERWGDESQGRLEESY